MTPVICFGQQPCGIFPNRFLFAKIRTARRLRETIGGRIVFFLHDSDHDHRETGMTLTNRQSGKVEQHNFEVKNKLQKLFTPLYLKEIRPEWKGRMCRCLPNLVEPDLVTIFKAVEASHVADFCLKMYQETGLLDDIEVVRSSDPQYRLEAIDIDDYFADLPYEGETVRARRREHGFFLHKGGDRFIEIPAVDVGKDQISPTRDTRLRWMQSIVQSTHYIAGAGEIQYLNMEEAPEISFVPRENIERSADAYAEINHEW